MIQIPKFLKFDPLQASIEGAPIIERRLSQLQGVFANDNVFEAALAELGDVLVYSVSSVSPADGDGQLHYGIGKILPGRIGNEYFMTKGHLHEWRIAAEIYIGLSGEGLMLLEDESGETTEVIDLLPNSVVYVPGHTAHRTVNTGTEPLTYIGIYPAQAGHDYGAIAERNFSQVVIEQDGKPVVIKRSALEATLG